VLILAIIVGGGILGYLRYFKKEIVLISQFPEIKKPEEKVETANWKTYQSPDGALRAQIIPAKKNLIGNAYESMVEIQTKEGRLLQTADYTSEDGDHGLIVARAEWTPDSQFFIYSAYSSGGHQPWFSRVYFYNRFDNKIYNFSELSGFTVANDEFTVTAPNIVTFTVYTSSSGIGPTTTQSFKLSEIVSTLNWKTYRNEEYGFEIKYPLEVWPYGKEGIKLEFFPVEKVENYIVVIQESSFAGIKNPYSPFPFYGGLGIKIIKSPEKDPVEKLIEEMQTSHLTEEYIAEKIQKVTVGKNIPAIKVNLSNNKFMGYDFYIKRENDIFIISFDNPGKIYYEDMFNQMLSTFRFLE
jgi:hypothetical protein